MTARLEARWHQLVAVNLAATVDQAVVGPAAIRVDIDGRPYVPTGDGGIVLGVELGDGAFVLDADHVAPGACLVHTDAGAGYALAAQSCTGNRVDVRSGAAAGAVGAIIGKRGEGSRVIAAFEQDVLRRLRPGDGVSVRTRGQGAAEPVRDVVLTNIEPELLQLLPVSIEAEHLDVEIRTSFPSRVVGNGIGRPTPMWDLDLQVDRSTAGRWNAGALALGDLVAIDDIDARFNAGYRRGWRSVGIVVHGSSPQPGHGPGVTVVLSGPAERIRLREAPDTHRGLEQGALLEFARVASERPERSAHASTGTAARRPE